MKFTQTKINLLACLFIAIMILLVSLNVSADKLNLYDDKNHHYDELVQGPRGEPGIDGLSIEGSAGKSGDNGLNFNSAKAMQGVAAVCASGSIPTSSHVDNHSHTSIGTGVCNYGNATGYSVGVSHMQGRLSFKGSVSTSGGNQSVGVGTSWAFE